MSALTEPKGAAHLAPVVAQTSYRRIWYKFLLYFVSLMLAFLWASDALAAEESPASGEPAPAARPDPCKGHYADYLPPFIPFIKADAAKYGSYWKFSAEQMKLSTEPHFFSLCQVEEVDRVNALVEAAIKKEQEGQFREALKLHQLAVEKYPEALYRVSPYGVFVPAGQYCQLRILQFPPEDLKFYRSLYDPKAKEAFEHARRQNSLLGLAEVAATMLATSYGDNALLELGNAALDAGSFLEAREYLATLRDHLPDSECRTAELELKIAYCDKMLGAKPSAGSQIQDERSALSPEDQARFQALLKSGSPEKSKFPSQLACAPNSSCDDYTLSPPSTDPLALQAPTWSHPLPDSRKDFFVYSQPVVTAKSLLYRHKNIIYCYSLLNGERRWANEMGGRIIWQNWQERQYPQEDLLVQDGLVISPITFAGSSLVALDEVTGQLRWARGPMAATNVDETRMRFEAAPAYGNRTIFSGYVLDNIEGQTHTDSEYGVMAFESSTGATRWRTPACRLAPGKFFAGFAEKRINRIRSFTSPPLCHQGTVYYNTNAGALLALDGLTGRIKWLMRYPYYSDAHDATRRFGGELLPSHGGVEFATPHHPMFWLNQRPLLIGESLFVAPVDSPFLFCLNRRDGKVRWIKPKMSNGFCYFLGQASTGELVVAGNGRNRRVFGWGGSYPTTGPVFLLNPETGETVWTSPDLIMPDEQPVMKHVIDTPTVHVKNLLERRHYEWFGISQRWFENAARPFLTSDGRLYVTSWADTSPLWRAGTHTFNLAEVSLSERKILSQRRYYTGEALTNANYLITQLGPKTLKMWEELPVKDAYANKEIEKLKEIVADRVPENAYGPFMPFSRMTFSRFGTQFELRFSPRQVSLVFDRQAVRQAVEKREDPEAFFARAELAIADSRYDEAAALLNKCLAAVSTEDLDFRALINQQLFQIHQRLARRGIFRAKPDEEMESCLGMTRTASTLAEEIETLFALAEAYTHKGDLNAAARCLRNVVATYGQHEYPVSALAAADDLQTRTGALGILEREGERVRASAYSGEMSPSVALLKQGFPLYFSTVSPLPKTLTVRAGEYAASKLIRLRKDSPEFAKSFDAAASKELEGRPAEEQLFRLWEFPATEAAQQTLEGLLKAVGTGADEAGRKRLWLLADAARICALKMPGADPTPTLPARENPTRSLPASGEGQGGVAMPYQERALELADSEGTSRLVLERRDDLKKHPNLVFLGGRTRKRSDNKFVLTCLDSETGKLRWEREGIRFLGNREKYGGDEGGFFEAFVHADLVVVHGLYDVFAFALADGEQRWRFKVPFNFEIKNSVESGDLLILAGQSETLALYLPASSPAGEVAWQEKEIGDVYAEPYFHGERLICVRKQPFNVTVRYRATGKLMGRLALPDLSLNEAHPLAADVEHPLLERNRPTLPITHDGTLLVVTDNWYYIALDVSRMAVLWKRLIDQNDLTREPALRFYLKGEYLVVVKENYDQKAIYLLSSQTGAVLWYTDPKEPSSPQPMHSVVLDAEKLYGIQAHPGQGFYLVSLELKTGKKLYSQEVIGFQAKPEVTLIPKLFGGQVVAQIQENQDFELRVFDAKDGSEIQKVAKKGVGPYGVHGRVSAEVQHGRLILLSKDQLGW